MKATLGTFLLARIAEDAAEARAPVATGGRHQRMLRECEAKRRIAEDHQWHPHVEATTCWECAQPAPCPTMRHMVGVYANHPDYRDEWKP